MTADRITIREVLRVIYLYNGGDKAYIGNQATVDTYDKTDTPVPPAVAPPANVEQASSLLTVTNSDDSGIGSLRDAVANAEDGDAIAFDDTIESIVLVSEILLDKSITIDGSGIAIISGDTKTRIFQVYNETEDIYVTLTGMGIVDAENSADAFGGAIYNNGENLTIENCLISNNANTFADGKGGAIYTSGTLTLNNCVFTDNTASEENDIYSTNGEVILE